VGGISSCRRDFLLITKKFKISGMKEGGFEQLNNPESIDSKRVYLYRDSLKGKYENFGGELKFEVPIVFECLANSIEEADRKYKEKFDVDPAKQPNIECLSVDAEE